MISPSFLVNLGSLLERGPKISKIWKKRNKAGKVAKRAILPEMTLNLSLVRVLLTLNLPLGQGSERTGRLLKGSPGEGVSFRGKRERLLREIKSSSRNLITSYLIISSRTS
jgi:hypothetical protein